jgi:hypothetical protein
MMNSFHISYPYRGAPFSVAHALAAGAPARRLRRRDLDAPFFSVRAARGSLEFLVPLCHAYAVRAGHDEFFSHVTAARLWQLPLPARLEKRRELDVSVFRPSNPPQAAGVIGHQISRAVPLRTVAGLAVAPAVETWIQLGAVLSLDDLIIAADAIVRRKRRLATLEQLRAAASNAYRRPGLRLLRAALDEVRPGTDSPRETLMRLIITRAGLPEPIVQFAVHNDHGDFVGTPDPFYPEYRIALEYEGDGHRTDPQTFNDDIERAELFQEAGCRYVRITRDHVDHPHRLVSRVRNVLIQRGWRP